MTQKTSWIPIFYRYIDPVEPTERRWDWGMMTGGLAVPSQTVFRSIPVEICMYKYMYVDTYTYVYDFCMDRSYLL